MRILVINYEFPPIGGGGGKASSAISREMAAIGQEVRVITSGYGGLPRREILDRYTVIRVRTLRRRMDRSNPMEMSTFMIAGALEAVQQAIRWKPDVSIAFFGIPSGPIAYMLRLFFGIPYLVSLRGGDVPGFRPRQMATYHKLTRPVIRFLWRHASAVVANSEGLKDLACQTDPTVDIRIIPNGVDQRSVSLRTYSEPEANLLFVGRLIEEKGVQYLVEAVSQIDDLPDLSVTIIGDGGYRSELEELARRRGAADRIRFTGWLSREAVMDYYDRASLFVLPTLGEGMPNVILEAMASGLPILSTDVSGCRDLVIQGKNGILVPAKDSNALVGALKTMLADPRQLAQMSRESLNTAARYSWKATAQAYLALIEQQIM